VQGGGHTGVPGYTRGKHSQHPCLPDHYVHTQQLGGVGLLFVDEVDDSDRVPERFKV